MTNMEAKILLVEDSQNDIDLTLHSLRRENLANRVQVLRDGEEALDYIFCQGRFAQRNPDPVPRLILLDLKLPKIDGLEVLRQLKSDQRTKTIPVVIITSSREEQDILRGYDYGANSYIQKPVDFDQFRSTVKTMGLYWLVVNQSLASNGAQAAGKR